MRYVIQHYSYWMVVALVLGLTAGWVAARQPNAVRSAAWVYAQIALAAIGEIVSADARAAAIRRRVRGDLGEVFLCFTCRKKGSTISIR